MSGSSNHASANINTGPISQFRLSEAANSFQARPTCDSSSYFTRARTGYIIQSRPRAMGSETSATLMASRA
jgi:hypothetical protein